MGEHLPYSITSDMLSPVEQIGEEMPRRDILHALGLSDRKSLRQRYLLPALQMGCVEMTCPDTPNDRNQKYRLTSRGRRVADTAVVLLPL